LGGVVCEYFRNNQKGFSVIGNGSLLLGSQIIGVMIEVNSESSFNTASSGDHEARFERSFDNAEGVMERSFDFIAHELVGSSNDDGSAGGLFETLEEDEIVITNCLFVDFLTFTEGRFVIYFLTFSCRERGDDGSSCGLSDLSQVTFVDSSETENAVFDHVLIGDVIDTLRGKNDISAGLNNLQDSLFEDFAFLESNFFEILGVRDEHLDTHLHLEFV
jgi:hypothetical protein